MRNTAHGHDDMTVAAAHLAGRTALDSCPHTQKVILPVHTRMQPCLPTRWLQSMTTPSIKPDGCKGAPIMCPPTVLPHLVRLGLWLLRQHPLLTLKVHGVGVHVRRINGPDTGTRTAHNHCQIIKSDTRHAQLDRPALDWLGPLPVSGMCTHHCHCTVRGWRATVTPIGVSTLSLARPQTPCPTTPTPSCRLRYHH